MKLRAAIVDTETTCFSHADDDLIELGLVLFEFDGLNGEVGSILSEYNGLVVMPIEWIQNRYGIGRAGHHSRCHDNGDDDDRNADDVGTSYGRRF